MLESNIQDTKFVTDKFLGWIPIKNCGQHNCGIYINDKEPNGIIKCGKGKYPKIFESVNIINTKEHLFPTIFGSFEIDDKYYIKMERLCGDITNFFFDLIPTMILNKMNIDPIIKTNMLELFKFKSLGISNNNMQSIYINSIGLYMYYHPDKISDLLFYENNENNENNRYIFDEYDYIHKCGHTIQDNNNKINSLIQSIKKLNIDFVTYKHFVLESILQIKKVFPEIIRAIANIRYKLNELGYIYNDNKFDNYGYKIVNDSSPYTFSYNDKYYRVFFLDPESGLSIRNNQTEFDVNDMINADLKENFRYFSVNGQNYLKNYNRSLIINNHIQFSKKNIYPEDVLDIDDNTLNLILSKFDLIF